MTETPTPRPDRPKVADLPQLDPVDQVRIMAAEEAASLSAEVARVQQRLVQALFENARLWKRVAELENREDPDNGSAGAGPRGE